MCRGSLAILLVYVAIASSSLQPSGDLTLYTIGSPPSLVTDLATVPVPVLDEQGVADYLNDPRCGAEPPADAVIASFMVSIDASVPRTAMCAQGAGGSRYSFMVSSECYDLDTFPEACTFKVNAVGKAVKLADLQGAGCYYGSCLVGFFQKGFKAAADQCAAGRRNVTGFDMDKCKGCTAKSTQAAYGPWYGETAKGWICHDDPFDHPPPKVPLRWMATPAMCECP